MKVILASSGLANEEMIDRLEGFVGKSRKNINVVIINEAIKGEAGDHRWFAEELQRICSVIGGRIEFVDLQAHDEDHILKRINEADMIFCFGGNTDYLANVFTKTGFDKILPKILQEKVWVGSSAGSCVLCNKESIETQSAVYKEKCGFDHYMNIIPIVFLPHLHGWFKFDKPEIIKASEATVLPVYALSDNAAIAYDGTNFDVLGNDYIIAQEGKIS